MWIPRLRNSWTWKGEINSLKFTDFWFHGFYEEEGERRQLWSTAELLLGKIVYCFLCFLGLSEVVWGWQNDFTVARSGGMFVALTLFMGSSYWDHFMKHSTYLPSVIDMILRGYICFYLQLCIFLLWTLDYINTDTIMGNVERLFKRNNFLYSYCIFHIGGKLRE